MINFQTSKYSVQVDEANNEQVFSDIRALTKIAITPDEIVQLLKECRRESGL